MFKRNINFYQRKKKRNYYKNLNFTQKDSPYYEEKKNLYCKCLRR